IRDRNVTGVQTCALPIYFAGRETVAALGEQVGRGRCGEGYALVDGARAEDERYAQHLELVGRQQVERRAVGERYALGGRQVDGRSEERRVGEEGRARGWR